MENLLGQFFSVSESPQAVADDVIALYELKKDIMCSVCTREMDIKSISCEQTVHDVF